MSNKNQSAELQVDMNLLAAVAQLFGIVLTVVYATEAYDFWDVTVAVFVVLIWWRYYRAFTPRPLSFHVALFGFAVALTILLMALIELLCYANGVAFSSIVAAFFGPSAPLLAPNLELGVSLVFYLALLLFLWVRVRIGTSRLKHTTLPK